MQPSMIGDPAAYYSVPIEGVERIEVIKGGSSVLYGPNAMGGVINFITKTPPQKPFEFALKETFGSYGTTSSYASIGGTKNTLSYMLAYLNNQGSAFRDHSSFRKDDLTFRTSVRPDSQSELSFGFNYYDERSDTPGGLTASSTTTTPSRPGALRRLRGQRFEGTSVTAGTWTPTSEAACSAACSSGTGSWPAASPEAISIPPAVRRVRPGAPILRYGRSSQLTVGGRRHGPRGRPPGGRGIARFRTGTTKVNADLRPKALYAENEFRLTERFSVTPASGSSRSS